MVGQLKAFSLPPEFPPLLGQLLYKPDRNRGETKALEAACSETGLSAAHLLKSCGAIRSARLSPAALSCSNNSRGHGLSRRAEAPPCRRPAACRRAAFSIDDATTTEIDDAFSLQTLPGLGWRVGIHIAAPGWASRRDRRSTRSRAQGCRRSTCRAARSPCCRIRRSSGFTLSSGRDCVPPFRST
jgi:exoribonuclease-2